MDTNEARAYVREHVHVDRADVEAAKNFLNRLSGHFNVEHAAMEFAATAAGGAPSEIALLGMNPSSSLDQFAIYVNSMLATFSAVWDLVHAGVLLPSGDAKQWYPRLAWSMMSGGSGSRGGIDFNDICGSYPEHAIRPIWRHDNGVLADGDFYLSALAATSLHPGIVEALKQAVASFRNGLFVPALAMLDAASEGSWFEAGQALATRPPVDPGGVKLTAVLQDSSKSMRSKSAAVCDYFETSALAKIDPQLFARNGPL